ncbi:copper-binding protein [Halomonas alkaliantarctica]|nr:copper-binding protein [Halomonas alkaliantarctica]
MRSHYLILGLLTLSLGTLSANTWAASEADIDRTISVEAGEMWFDPEDIHVTAGETIRFEITNTGSIQHEFAIGDKAAQKAHREMMREMSAGHGGHGGHDMAEGAHGGQMPSVTLAPGESQTLVWTAPDDVEHLEYACNLPGHYESGMYGDITF